MKLGLTVYSQQARMGTLDRSAIVRYSEIVGRYNLAAASLIPNAINPVEYTYGCG